MTVTYEDIVAAAQRMAGEVRMTPMLRKDQLIKSVGVPVYLKGEHLQRTGSFKIRGALNLALQLSDADRQREFVAASAGNHAQGVAVAAGIVGAKARIFMPETVTLAKLQATQAYGASCELIGASLGETLEKAHEYASANDGLFVHPFDDDRIIAGQGTVGLEILEQVPDAATVVIPIGGGGLFAGVALALKSARPDIHIVGVQAQACDSVRPSLEAGHPVRINSEASIADGISVKQIGEHNFPYIQEYADDIIVVSEDAIAKSILWLVERAKQVVEGSGAAAFAAVMSGKVRSDGPIVCLLSGGNIDSMLLMSVLRNGLTSAGRFVTLTTLLPDRPGELARLLSLLAGKGVNVLGVSHRREGQTLDIHATQVEITLETRDRDHVGEVIQVMHTKGYKVRVIGQADTMPEPARA